MFFSNRSATYIRGGGLEIRTNEQEVQVAGLGEYGSDTVGLELSTGQTKMSNQTIASVPTLDAEFGLVGVLPNPAVYSPANSFPQSWRQVSFFRSLQNSTRIAGQTWSYQAGAYNREFDPIFKR
jgi:hypothetical protein